MAQKLTKKFRQTFLEYLILTTIVIIFIVLFDKYILSTLQQNQNEKHQHIKTIGNEITTIKHSPLNFSQRAHHNKNEKNLQKKYYAKLQKNGEKWSLVGAPKTFHLSFSSDNKLQIKGYAPFIVKIKDFTQEYYSIDKTVTLDIPKDASSFMVYEQEDALPIFGYHYVVSDKDQINKPSLEIHLSEFDKQINYLTNKLGCRWFTFADIMENYVIKNKKIPQRACVLNFDDGRKDSYFYIFPILKKYKAVGTFYIITHLLGKPAYMTWEQVDQLYLDGNEIGSHTLFGGSLVHHQHWFEEKLGKKFTHNELEKQIIGPKEELESRGYSVKTFAYPLGEWNQEIENIVKKNYIAARDIERPSKTLCPKTPTLSFDDSFIWHMHYHHIENENFTTIKQGMAYNHWWQFEDGYKIISSNQNSVRQLNSLYDLTSTTYHIVDLRAKNDQIINKFIIPRKGSYQIEIFGSTGELGKSKYYFLKNIKIFIDNKQMRIFAGNSKQCKKNHNTYYCSYFIKNVELEPGVHTISVKNIGKKFLRLDKFRIFRKFKTKKSYEIEIIS